MGLFGKKKREEKAAEAAAAADAPANYSTTLDWLLGLSDKDYTKMGKIVEIYRKANSDTAKTLGIKTEPTSFLPQPDNTQLVPQDVNHLAPNSASQPASDESDFLGDDDDLAAAFLEDEPPKPATPAPAKPLKVEVKDENDKTADKPKG